MSVDELIKKYHLEDQVEARMNENRNNNWATEGINRKNTCDEAINKLTNATYILLIIFVFTIITILVLKYSSREGFIYDALIGMPQGIAKSFIDVINERLMLKDIAFSEKAQETLSYIISVYWVTSSLCGYAVATKTFGIGLIQFIIKFVFCPVISPLVMPIVVFVKVISVIKNLIILKWG